MSPPDPSRRKRVSVVLSFYNEEEVLPELIARLQCSLDPLPVDYELIFVNDASTDGSRRLLEARAAADARIKLLTMSRNFDRRRHGGCVLAGIAHSSGEAVIYMDTDLQDPPEVLPRLISAWIEGEGVDIVYTTRLSRVGDSLGRRAVTALGYRILRWMTEGMVPVDSGDFKLLSRRAADQLLRFREKRPFLRGMVPWVGFKQVQVTYDRRPRFAGRSHYPILTAPVIYNFFNAIVAFSDRPLRAVFWLGLAVPAAAVLVLLGVAAAGAAGWAVPLTPLLAGAGLAVGSLQMLALGILSIYVLSIWDQARDRPLYVVESAVGWDSTDPSPRSVQRAPGSGPAE